jgi:hypothetical protein
MNGFDDDNDRPVITAANKKGRGFAPSSGEEAKVLAGKALGSDVLR